jgi:hypothetical protein
VYTKEELQVIADLCIKYDTLCISDEVYEWLVYTGNKHLKIGTEYYTGSQISLFLDTCGTIDRKVSQFSFKITFVWGSDEYLKIVFK